MQFHPRTALETIAHHIRTTDELSYDDLSYALFTTEAEQRAFDGTGVYTIYCNEEEKHRVKTHLDQLTNTYHQHHNQYCLGPFPFAGLYGIIPTVIQIVKFNVLTHPLLENIRQGNWLLDYLLQRLRRRPSLSWLVNALEGEIEYIKQCPRNTRPVKFCRLLLGLDQYVLFQNNNNKINNNNYLIIHFHI